MCLYMFTVIAITLCRCLWKDYFKYVKRILFVFRFDLCLFSCHSGSKYQERMSIWNALTRLAGCCEGPWYMSSSHSSVFFFGLVVPCLGKFETVSNMWKLMLGTSRGLTLRIWRNIAISCGGWLSQQMWICHWIRAWWKATCCGLSAWFIQVRFAYQLCSLVRAGFCALQR
jgi:hypothetical protein